MLVITTLTLVAEVDSAVVAKMLQASFLPLFFFPWDVSILKNLLSLWNLPKDLVLTFSIF